MANNIRETDEEEQIASSLVQIQEEKVSPLMVKYVAPPMVHD
jgi:hypothetical protein